MLYTSQPGCLFAGGWVHYHVTCGAVTIRQLKEECGLDAVELIELGPIFYCDGLIMATSSIKLPVSGIPS